MFREELFGLTHVHPKPGRTLIVGSFIVNKPDRRATFPEAIGVDMRSGPGVDVVANMEEPQPQLGVFSHIECCSVLEHSRRPWRLARNLEALLEPAGTIHIQVPFAWRVHNYPDDYWRMTASAIRDIFGGIHWEVLLYQSHKGFHESARAIPSLAREDTHYFAKSMICGFGIKMVE